MFECTLQCLHVKIFMGQNKNHLHQKEEMYHKRHEYDHVNRSQANILQTPDPKKIDTVSQKRLKQTASQPGKTCHYSYNSSQADSHECLDKRALEGILVFPNSLYMYPLDGRPLSVIGSASCRGLWLGWLWFGRLCRFRRWSFCHRGGFVSTSRWSAFGVGFGRCGGFVLLVPIFRTSRL